jgi:hypothetical protein
VEPNLHAPIRLRGMVDRDDFTVHLKMTLSNHGAEIRLPTRTTQREAHEASRCITPMAPGGRALDSCPSSLVIVAP